MRRAGFRGSVQLKGDPLIHGIARNDFHYTICGFDVDKRDDRHMSGNGKMQIPTCLECWVSPDPFP